MALITSADDLLSKGEKLFGKKTVPFNNKTEAASTTGQPLLLIFNLRIREHR